MAKIGAPRFDIRDPYHFAVSLSWSAFFAGFLGIWACLNLLFAFLYFLDPGGVANARPGSFSDVFFFSIETLATVGYGVMAPGSLYTHIVSAAEIVTGTVFTAIVTGLLFVRFSRPRARILFAENAVITHHNGHPTLMIRFVNGRTTAMTSARIRLSVLLAETTAEGHFYRRIHHLPLEQSEVPLFVMPWTAMHRITPDSPLHGFDAASLARSDTRLFVTIDATDRVLAADVRDLRSYDASQIRFGMHYADAVTLDADGNAVADLTRLSLLEPDAPVL